MLMEKDGSGESTGKDAELDALLSAADRGMLEAIRDNLDLDTGFAHILGDVAGITLSGRPTEPAEAEPGGHAQSYGRTLAPVLACEVAGAAHKIPASAASKSHREPLHHHRALITLALAVVTALNIAVLCSFSQNHRAVGALHDANATSPTFRPIAGEPTRDFYFFPPPRLQQLIVLANKVGTSVSLRFAADSAGGGGDPVISYLRDSRSGPVFCYPDSPQAPQSGFSALTLASHTGTASKSATGTTRSLPSGEQFSPGTMICIAGGNGRVMLKTVQNQSNAQIGV